MNDSRRRPWTGPAAPKVRLEGVAEVGRGRYVFEAPGRRVHVEPWRPSLAAALSGVRLGETMVDREVGREILRKLDIANASLARAKATERARPVEAREMGLSQAIARFQAMLDAPKVVHAKAIAQRAVLLGSAQSLPDDEIAAVQDVYDVALTLDGIESSVRLAPVRPGTVTIPPIVPKTEPFPWWGYAGIGAGVLLGVIGLAYLLAPKSAPAAVAGRARAA